MREMTHDNLLYLHGALQFAGRVYFVTEHCAKGSLGHFLRNSPLKLDWSLRRAIIFDIVSGLHFLHQSEVSRSRTRLEAMETTQLPSWRADAPLCVLYKMVTDRPNKPKP